MLNVCLDVPRGTYILTMLQYIYYVNKNCFVRVIELLCKGDSEVD